MRYLADTHALIWYLQGDSQLSKKALNILDSERENVYVSIISTWEIAIKVNIGKLILPYSIDEIFKQIKIEDFNLLNLQPQHIIELSKLELHHRDPFDRILISQSLVEDFKIISIDSAFDSYPIERIW